MNQKFPSDMSHYPTAIQKLIDRLTRLPGLGPKSAERLVFYLLYQPADQLAELAGLIQHLKDKIIVCPQCQNFSENNPCLICANPRRNQGVICVVSRPQDVAALEKIGDYQGVYHILGGVIDPLEGITAEKLKIKELVNRLKNQPIHEVILGLNPDMPGETTILYLTKLLKSHKVPKISRLARGLPVGSDLEYTDEVTLGDALKGRREI